MKGSGGGQWRVFMMGRGEIVRRIDVEAMNAGYLLVQQFDSFSSSTFSGLVSFVVVTITFEDSCYTLRFDQDAYNAKLEGSAEIAYDESVEEAFGLKLMLKC